MITFYPKNITILTFDTVIFDLGGVLVDINPKKLNKIIGNDFVHLSVETCKKMLFSKPFQQNAIGLISLDEAINQLYKEFPSNQVDIFKVKPIISALEPLPQGQQLFQIARTHRKKILILSNITPQSFEHVVQTTPFISQADGYITSFMAKSRKPHTPIYQTLIKNYNVTRSTALFIDDSNKNCKAAIDLGIASLVCNYHYDIVGFFQKLLLIKG